MSGSSGAVRGGAGGGGGGWVESDDDFEGLAHEAGERRLLDDEPRQKVGEGRAFLSGPLRGQHFDHVGDESGKGLELSVKRIPIHQKDVLRVIHFLDGLAQANEVVGDAGQLGLKGFAGRGSGHEHEPPVWKTDDRFGRARREREMTTPTKAGRFAGAGINRARFRVAKVVKESLKSPRVSQPFWGR